MTWQTRAVCVDEDPNLFFPGEGQSAEPAKVICRRCPVQFQCGQTAIALGETNGVWGGMSAREITEARRDPETGLLRRKCGSCDDFSAGLSPWCEPCRKKHRAAVVRRYDQKRRANA